jgi:hypothetical protein
MSRCILKEDSETFKKFEGLCNFLTENKISLVVYNDTIIFIDESTNKPYVIEDKDQENPCSCLPPKVEVKLVRNKE